MSRMALHQLRWCQTTSDVISGGLWVPMGNVVKAIRPDFPLPGRPHAFAMPTVYKWGRVRNGKESGRRLFYTDLGGLSIIGGVHMTSSAFIPTALLKELTATEDDYFDSSINIPFLLSMDMADIELEQRRFYTLYYKQMWKDDLGLIINMCVQFWKFKCILDPVEFAKDVEAKLPWFLDCNRERFPYWFGREDGRNKILLERIKKMKISIEGAKKCPFLLTRTLYGDPNNKGIFIEHLNCQL